MLSFHLLLCIVPVIVLAAPFSDMDQNVVSVSKRSLLNAFRSIYAHPLSFSEHQGNTKFAKLDAPQPSSPSIWLDMGKDGDTVVITPGQYRWAIRKCSTRHVKQALRPSNCMRLSVDIVTITPADGLTVEGPSARSHNSLKDATQTELRLLAWRCEQHGADGDLKPWADIEIVQKMISADNKDLMEGQATTVMGANIDMKDGATVERSRKTMFEQIVTNDIVF
ncbi:uncharacterized protein BYT42DRAFT_561217 [Radiomyces spectabilis]|uniref:uncharacterized protein n=1 Tax=Radiomyces spectabilis TaxID=64574 RepID=UPI00221FCA3B|nr:uncharacterized protein BYT42DRAFT_561217 [Radiomyces spectabilis]KAI8388781.1 hypothetical protein BYT42DRAFT_561217 [Radiomyces spectabilis]